MGILANSAVAEFLTVSHVLWSILVVLATPLLYRILYTQFFHPLAKFPGPWYATSTSLYGAIISVRKEEPEFLRSLVKKYGSTC